MTFRLVCGDVMPGCVARFENDDKDALLAEVARHAEKAHDLVALDEDTLAAVEAKIAVDE